MRKKTSTPDALLKASKKKDIELTEQELEKVSGGHAHHHKGSTGSSQTPSQTLSGWDLQANKKV
jgi:bacteriocin-like protein